MVLYVGKGDTFSFALRIFFPTEVWIGAGQLVISNPCNGIIALVSSASSFISSLLSFSEQKIFLKQFFLHFSGWNTDIFIIWRPLSFWFHLHSKVWVVFFSFFDGVQFCCCSLQVRNYGILVTTASHSSLLFSIEKSARLACFFLLEDPKSFMALMLLKKSYKFLCFRYQNSDINATSKKNYFSRNWK